MKVIDGIRFYKKQMDEAVRIDEKGWDSYDGRNYQWYSLYYNPDCGYVMLDADNSGDCFGNYSTEYFSSPAKFAEWCEDNERSWESLLGDVDETNAAALKFIDEILK